MASQQPSKFNSKSAAAAAAATAAENDDQVSVSPAQEKPQDSCQDHGQSLALIADQRNGRVQEERNEDEQAPGLEGLHQQHDQAIEAAASASLCAPPSGQPINNTGFSAQTTGSQRKEVGKPEALDNFQNRGTESSTTFVSSIDDVAGAGDDAAVSHLQPPQRSPRRHTRNEFEHKQHGLDPSSSNATAATIAANFAEQNGAQAAPNNGLALTKYGSNNEATDNQRWSNQNDRENGIHCTTLSPLASSSPASPSLAVSPTDSTLTATTADSTPASSVISAPTSRLTRTESLSLPSLSSARRSSSLTPNNRHIPGNHFVRLQPQEELVEATLIVEDYSTTHHSDSSHHNNNADLELEGFRADCAPIDDNSPPEAPPRMGLRDDVSQLQSHHSTPPTPLIAIAQAKPAHVEDSFCDVWKSRTGKMLICALITVVVVVAGGIAFAVNSDDSNNDPTEREAAAQESMFKDETGTFIEMGTTAAPTTTTVVLTDTEAIESETSLSSLNTTTPTEAPTTNSQGSIVALLPNYTLVSLQDPTSPQSKALKWLTQAHSPEFLSELTDNRILQRFALASFYYAANGNGWHWRRYWLSTEPSVHECDWWSQHHELPGFTGASSSCNQDTLEFEKLALSLNNLKGYLVPEVALLTSLKEISLTGDTFFPALIDQTNVKDKVLSGSLPAEWLTSLPKLTSLDISKNALSGSIATEIGLLRNLKKLHLNENDFQSQIPSELFGLTKLEELWLFQNQFSSSLPTEMGTLKEKSLLISFLAYDNFLEGSLPSEIGSLQQLTQLKVGLNRLTGTVPAEITNLQDLRFLFLEDNQLSGTIHSSFGKMTGLLALQFGNNRKL